MPGGCRSPTTDRARLSSIWRRLCDSRHTPNRDTPLHPSTPLLSSLHELRRHAPHDRPGRCLLSRYPSNQKKIWRGVEGYICPGDGPTLGVVEEGWRRRGGGNCCKSMLHCSISIDMRRSIVGDYRPRIPLQPSPRSGSGVLHVWRRYNGNPLSASPAPVHVPVILHSAPRPRLPTCFTWNTIARPPAAPSSVCYTFWHSSAAILRHVPP